VPLGHGSPLLEHLIISRRTTTRDAAGTATARGPYRRDRLAVRQIRSYACRELMTSQAHPEIVQLVPHTHWDREWYEPFQVFRFRLVRLLDEVLVRAEHDPEFRFTLDGQMAAVDDYLEVRPEHRDRVAALVRGGQLAVGPWQILLDEFLCSGETIVRNLELGWRRAEELGAVMPVGYLPDMFGHCAQMPQILRRAGIRHACVWRGVPASVSTHAFRWASPDGSWLRTEYLYGGYGNGVDLFAVPGELGGSLARHYGAVADWFGDDPQLAMFGTDHMAPLPGLMDLVRELPAAGAPVQLAVTTLTDYVTAYDPDEAGLTTVTGELRSHARANILPGVLSVRGQLKAAMARAEQVVERYAEPFAALWSTENHQRFLDMAWRRIIDCSCHDSVTGCGVDETAVQVAARLAEAEQLGCAVRDQVVAGLAAAVPSDGFVVLNPSPEAREGLVEVTVVALDETADVVPVLADGTALAMQELERSPILLTDEVVPADRLGQVLARVYGRELFQQQVERVVLKPGEITFHVAPAPSTEFDPAGLRATVAAHAEEWDGDWRVRILAAPTRRVLVSTPVPALSWAAVRAEQPTQQQSAAREQRSPHPAARQSAAAQRASAPAEVSDPAVMVGDRGLENGRVRVTVAADGTMTAHGEDGTTMTGVGRLVDGGDRGDSYNWGPPADDRLVDTPDSVLVEVLERGPLRAVLVVDRDYRWPTELTADRERRSEATEPVRVRTLVELRCGEPFVRLAVSFRNPSADHRLRLHVPLPEPTGTSYGEGQFAVTARGLTSEGGGGEHPLPTFPASAFVTAGDATVLLDRVSEYELVNGGRELAVTVLRSVGWLSVNLHPLRYEPAGPRLATPAAQRLGETVEVRLGVLPRAGGWGAAGALRAAELFRHDLVARTGTAGVGDPLPTGEAGLSVSGDGVALSSLRRRDGALELRVVAMSATATVATVRGRFATATRVDLLGAELDVLDADLGGELTLPLAPWEIATLRLT